MSLWHGDCVLGWLIRCLPTSLTLVWLSPVITHLLLKIYIFCIFIIKMCIHSDSFANISVACASFDGEQVVSYFFIQNFVIESLCVKILMFCSVYIPYCMSSSMDVIPSSVALPEMYCIFNVSVCLWEVFPELQWALCVLYRL